MCYVYNIILNAVYIFTINNGAQFRLPKYCTNLKFLVVRNSVAFGYFASIQIWKTTPPPPLAVVVQPS
jgi:hypothetical protein